MAALLDPEPVNWPLVLFSAKEAVYKAVFRLVRTVFWFDAVEVDILEPGGANEGPCVPGTFVTCIDRSLMATVPTVSAHRRTFCRHC